MIIYDAGEYHVGFIWSLEGSTFPKAAMFSVPAAVLGIVCRWMLNAYPGMLFEVSHFGNSAAWSVTVTVLSVLIGFRTNKAYARFWEGTTLVQQMRAEWFEACNNLMAFSKMAIVKAPKDQEVQRRVFVFQNTLIRLVSLMHGAALRQVTGGDGEGEEFEVLDVQGLDDESMDYLGVECGLHEINRVEVLLHWVQVLITDSIGDGVLVVPPPILTRSYQTLSRGMVNLHNVRKLADVPFPFPLSQMIIVLLLIQTILTPLLMAALFQTFTGVFVFTFIPLFGMWNITFISGELEQPFGQDPNDLPLSELQFEMNNSLLMLLDDRAQRAPGLKDNAIMDTAQLRAHLGDPESSTSFLGNPPPLSDRISRMKKNRSSVSVVLPNGTRRPSDSEIQDEFLNPNAHYSSEVSVEKRSIKEEQAEKCFDTGTSDTSPLAMESTPQTQGGTASSHGTPLSESDNRDREAHMPRAETGDDPEETPTEPSVSFRQRTDHEALLTYPERQTASACSPRSPQVSNVAYPTVGMARLDGSTGANDGQSLFDSGAPRVDEDGSDHRSEAPFTVRPRFEVAMCNEGAPRFQVGVDRNEDVDQAPAVGFAPPHASALRNASSYAEVAPRAMQDVAAWQGSRVAPRQDWKAMTSDEWQRANLVQQESLGSVIAMRPPDPPCSEAPLPGPPGFETPTPLERSRVATPARAGGGPGKPQGKPGGPTSGGPRLGSTSGGTGVSDGDGSGHGQANGPTSSGNSGKRASTMASKGTARQRTRSPTAEQKPRSFEML
eukprot:TRINITY_DN3195_c0_g1_i2.p1 TRINITY_DN3195_c0_g1~~TRINITY_DN3195_c0_g1_i2.p1  ORF type:complete len:776 (-),score=105.58 TRINITY_DN3195_c0_g1_i2:164-2491(-)